MLRTKNLGCKIWANFKKISEITMKNHKKQEKPKPVISKADQDMINELDYEYKKAHKPYDKWERHWDEA
jgi:hypothetical protein